MPRRDGEPRFARAADGTADLGPEIGGAGRQFGDTGGEISDVGGEIGDTGSQIGDVGGEIGDVGSQIGDVGGEIGDAGSEIGDTGGGIGDAGSEIGDTGGEAGDAGPEIGDAGGQTGDAGPEIGDAGGQTGDGGPEIGDARGVIGDDAPVIRDLGPRVRDGGPRVACGGDESPDLGGETRDRAGRIADRAPRIAGDSGEIDDDGGGIGDLACEVRDPGPDVADGALDARHRATSIPDPGASIADAATRAADLVPSIPIPPPASPISPPASPIPPPTSPIPLPASAIPPPPSPIPPPTSPTSSPKAPTPRPPSPLRRPPSLPHATSLSSHIPKSLGAFAPWRLRDLSLPGPPIRPPPAKRRTILPMPRAQSAPPPPGEDRTTERRIIPSAPFASMPADSTREVSQEDFLFHLYRGSELLQENRVLEAKEELEFALTMQPSDPKGQDLLGAVYFRLGLYPRAIQIYESIEAAFPADASIKVNLALAYLKTGQPAPARRALQDAVRINPEHKRAWGYLGLALQKLGEIEQAQIAYERGGHVMMAKRIAQETARRQRTGQSVPPEAPGPELDEGVRSAAATAFSELDAGELRFALAQPSNPKPGEGQWHPHEIGDSVKLPRSVPPPSLGLTGHGLALAAPSIPLAPRSVHETATAPPPPLAPVVAALDVEPPPVSTRVFPPPMPGVEKPTSIPAVAPADEVPPSLLGTTEGPPVAVHPSGVVLARVVGDLAFATRLDALRVVAGSITTRVLHRRVRDADTTEVLGGIGSPFVRASGDARLVLGARPAHRLAVIALDDEIAFVREDALVGFELRLGYENGRLALDPPGEGARSNDAVPIAQLKGHGAVVMELAGELASLPCAAGRPLYVRREWIVAWLGRLVPRALPPTESPSGQRGLVAFSGEGTVLVCAS
jgi:hypothetical protein